MQPSPPASEPADDHEELEQAHAKVRTLVASVEAVTDPRELSSILDELHALLRPHFAMEERPGGFYAEILERQPGFDHRVRQLEREHIEINARLDELRAGFERLATVAEQLRTRSIDLVRQLAQHERTESQLTVDSYYLDLGGGD